MISCSKSYSEAGLDSFWSALGHVDNRKIVALLTWLLLLVVGVRAQGSGTNDPVERIVEVKGTSDATVFGMGESLRIVGTVKQGAISFGGDVIVEGTVEGDVASIGGSVIQRDGSTINGDVIVLGGTYQHGENPNRGPTSKTMMYAGYQQELRNIMRNPTGLLRPSWSPGYLGLRILAVLFWFVVSLAFTSAMPGTISRGVARLQLTSLRVALIGLIGSVVIGAGVAVSLWALPETLSVLVGLMALVLLLMAALVGRVIIYAATGRWLQRKYLPIAKHSEAVALLLGSSFWVLLTSLPYLWPFVVSVILVLSLGLALTARYRVDWRRAQVDPFF